MTLSPELLGELKAKHKRLRTIEFETETVALVPPKRVAFKCFQDRTKAEDADNVAALEELTKGCIVFPAQDALEAFLDDEPGALMTAGVVALELAGVSQKLKAKKA